MCQEARAIALDRDGVQEAERDLLCVADGQTQPKGVIDSAVAVVESQVDHVAMGLWSAYGSQGGRLVDGVQHSGASAEEAFNQSRNQVRRLMSGGLLVGALGNTGRPKEFRPQVTSLQPPEPGDRLVVGPLAHRRGRDLEESGHIGIGTVAEGLSELDLGHGLRVHGATLRPLNASVKSTEGRRN